MLLGLHKDSFNYLNQCHSVNKAQNLQKLRQFYQTLDRSKEREKFIEITPGKALMQKAKMSTQHSAKDFKRLCEEEIPYN